jgi:hypothetical protein
MPRIYHPTGSWCSLPWRLQHIQQTSSILYRTISGLALVVQVQEGMVSSEHCKIGPTGNAHSVILPSMLEAEADADAEAGAGARVDICSRD